MQLTENFNSWEFDSPDFQNSGTNMKLRFISSLQEARTIADIPFVITSGYRTKEHNEKVEGVKNSAHMVGKAADIACHTSINRFRIVAALLEVKFTRIGIYATYIHVDDDESKSSEVIFLA